jgi:hypothetical protein
VAILTISLTDTEQAFVDTEAERRGLAREEFIRSLVERELTLTDTERVDQLLLEGLASDGREVTSTTWAEIRQEVLDRH